MHIGLLLQASHSHALRKRISMYFLDDKPPIRDRLGFESTATAIVNTIKNAAQRPLTVGVFGGCGTGKTSLMQMIEARLIDEGIKTAGSTHRSIPRRKVIVGQHRSYYVRFTR
jgi:ABC-type Na+ transport system ATPase subunit NatA